MKRVSEPGEYREKYTRSGSAKYCGVKKGDEVVFMDRDGTGPYQPGIGFVYVEKTCIVTGFNWPLILTDWGSWHYSRLKSKGAPGRKINQ